MISNNTQAFLALVRAGLWEKEVQLSQFGNIDFNQIYRLAEEQSVVGLVAAGIEHVVDIKVPQECALQFVGTSLQLEQRNQSMNSFVASLIDKMHNKDIYTLLIKGQGIAQCYERPLWRSSGDVDFLLSTDNYKRAKNYLSKLADHVDEEDVMRLHLGLSFGQWIVELHGSLRTHISTKINKVIDEVHSSIFYGGNVRSWLNNGVQIFLPSSDNDIIIVFTHFIDHFYGEGVGLRQICDWSRLMWTFRDNINHQLLERRVKEMGLMSEWNAFATFVIDYLGMPEECMPLFSNSKCYKRKSQKICKLVLETGNFGHNRDNSYRNKYPKAITYIITFYRRLGEYIRLATIFPLNAPSFFVSYTMNRFKSLLVYVTG